MLAKEPLEDVKRPLILLLLKLGSTSVETALALQVDSSQVRRMFPVRQIRKIVKSAED